MSSGFSQPPSASDPDGRYTDMELQAIKAKREGKRTEVTAQATEGQQVVGLEELAPEAPAVQPPAPVSAETLAAGPPPPRVSAEDLEKLAEVAFGPKPGADSLEEQRVPDVSDTGLAQTLCPNCSWDISQPKEYHPTDEDKAEFVRAVLGNRRFHKVVSFLDGKLNVRYRSTTVAEEYQVQEEVKRDTEQGAFGGMEWISLYRKYQLLFMLEEIDYAGNITPYPEITSKAYAIDKGESLIKIAYEQTTRKWGTMVHAMLLRGCIAMNDIFGEMTTKAEQPDFWRGLPVK